MQPSTPTGSCTAIANWLEDIIMLVGMLLNTDWFMHCHCKLITTKILKIKKWDKHVESLKKFILFSRWTEQPEVWCTSKDSGYACLKKWGVVSAWLVAQPIKDQLWCDALSRCDDVMIFFIFGIFLVPQSKTIGWATVNGSGVNPVDGVNFWSFVVKLKMCDCACEADLYLCTWHVEHGICLIVFSCWMNCRQFCEFKD